jgi:hypothetical protein
MNIEAPITPSAISSQLRRPKARWPSAISESVPPSPLLSARSSSSTYLAVTTMNSAHRISDNTPSTMARVTGSPWCAAPVTASRKAYNGEVPISPKTTPILPSVSAQKPVVTGASAWASVDVSLTAMVMKNALPVISIRARVSNIARQALNHTTADKNPLAHCHIICRTTSDLRYYNT